MDQQTSSEALISELKSLRERVMGVTESIIATNDGLLVAADVATVHPESMAALASATMALGRRTATQAGIGGLRDVVNRSDAGYVVFTAIGQYALLVVAGDEGLDLSGLRREGIATVDRLGELLAHT
jgi:predicted regulator of Ras-like GTPase activity (Roadblock/LC7/MglB family)